MSMDYDDDMDRLLSMAELEAERWPYGEEPLSGGGTCLNCGHPVSDHDAAGCWHERTVRGEATYCPCMRPALNLRVVKGERDGD